ncbi:Uncharacterised protein [Serratia plymuthica]|nr:Uncharacterised protein [Serratia plymuthica]
MSVSIDPMSDAKGQPDVNVMGVINIFCATVY